MEYTIRQDDVLMSYLPLAHMFERCCEVSRVLVRMTRKKMIIIKFIYSALLLLNTHTHTTICALSSPPFSLQNALFMVGGSVVFFSGDVKVLSDDMKIAKPTLLPGECSVCLSVNGLVC